VQLLERPFEPRKDEPLYAETIVLRRCTGQRAFRHDADPSATRKAKRTPKKPRSTPAKRKAVADDTPSKHTRGASSKSGKKRSYVEISDAESASSSEGEEEIETGAAQGEGEGEAAGQ
jgi:hypothetical protein